MNIYQQRPNVPNIINWVILSQYPALGRTLREAKGGASSLVYNSRPESILPEKAEELSVQVMFAKSLRMKLSANDRATWAALCAMRRDLNAPTPFLHICTSRPPLGYMLLNSSSAFIACVLSSRYCGNVPPVKKAVQAAAKEWGFLYSEESFAW